MKSLFLITILTTLISGSLFADDNLLKLEMVVKEFHSKGAAFEHIEFNDSPFAENHFKTIEVTIDKSQCFVSKEVEGVLRCPKGSSALVRILNGDWDKTVEFDQNVDDVLVMVSRQSNSRITTFGGGKTFKTETNEYQEILINIRLEDGSKMNVRTTQRVAHSEI